MDKTNGKYSIPVKALMMLLPLVYLFLGYYFRNLLGNLSLRSCDPEYIYFMSGLTLSDGAIKLGHFDNPGTPLQVLMALLFRMIWFIRGARVPFLDDVFLNPDLYLAVTSLLITSLTAALIWYSGLKIWQYTRSSVYALLVQTAPFLPVIWYDLIGRVAPELMMPFPVMLLMVLLIKIYSEDKAPTNRQIIGFSLIVALGLSVKLTFLPIWVIPFLVIKGWKNKVKFVVFSFLFFFIIAFPVTLQIEFFWNWVKGLFLHSGQYGGGESNVIDFGSLRANLRELYNYERRFFLLFIGLIVVFAAHMALLRKKVENRLVWISLALIVAISAQLLMVGKHYAHRYFVPVLMLSPLTVIFIAEIIRKTIPGRITGYVIAVAALFTIGWNLRDHKHWLPIKTEAMQTDVANRIPTWHFVSLLDKHENYKIIASQNYGSPFIEYILTYSHVWANHRKRAEYAPVLDRLYPHTFNYFTWDNSLRSWAEKFDAGAIIGSGKKVYLYLELDKEDLYNRTLQKLSEESATPFTCNREFLYRNPATTEVIYQLHFSVDGAKTDEGASG